MGKTKEDSLEHVRKIQQLTAKKKEIPSFKPKPHPFWNTECPDDIFKAHPDSAQSILYRPYRRQNKS